MAIRYVRKTGSDANGGTGPTDAWLTIGKALGAAGIASGDTVYIGAGTYREAVTVAMTSATAETLVVGDVDGGFTGDAGRVEWTAFTTDDTTTPSTSATLNLAGRDFLTFRHIDFVGANKTSNGDVIDAATTPGSTTITIEDCTIEGATPSAGSAAVSVTNVTTNALVWRFRRCLLDFASRGVMVNLVANASADYDADVLFENCVFYGIGRDSAVRVGVSGTTNTFGGGGVDLRYCDYYGGAAFLSTNDASIADGANACTVEHCWGRTNGTAILNANAAGQITEDWNYWHNSSAHTNVTNGTNNIQNPTAVAKRRGKEFGQSWLHGGFARPFGEPLPTSPALGAHTAASSPPSVDVRNRPRPAGGADVDYAIGAFERHDTARVGASLGGDAGGYGEIVGPGDQEFLLWVTPVATTVTVKVKWDATHGDTTKPQLERVANGSIGVTGATATATGTAGSAYETMTSTFTPTGSGLVRFRLRNRSAAGNGILAYDTWAVST